MAASEIGFKEGECQKLFWSRGETDSVDRWDQTQLVEGPSPNPRVSSYHFIMFLSFTELLSAAIGHLLGQFMCALSVLVDDKLQKGRDPVFCRPVHTQLDIVLGTKLVFGKC